MALPPVAASADSAAMFAVAEAMAIRGTGEARRVSVRGGMSSARISMRRARCSWAAANTLARGYAVASRLFRR
jgi:hypothetical protein